MSERADHWSHVWVDREPTEVSWHQPDPATSLRLVRAVTTPDDAVIDIGSGASRLPAELVCAGYHDVTALDISAEALERQHELTPTVEIVVADVTSWCPGRAYACWHDRATYHFLVDLADRRAYVDVASRAVGTGGHLVIATFALDGPEQCSGLPVRRCDAAMLAADFAPGFVLVDATDERHRTPWGAEQHFQYATLRRT